MKLTVMSLNLWHGGRLMEPIIALLKDVRPEVLLCQEVLNSEDESLEPRFRTMATFSERLGFEYSAYAPAQIQICDEGRIPGGSAVFSRFPILSSEVDFFNEPFNDHYDDSLGFEAYSTSPRPLQTAVVQLPVGKLRILNMHGVWDLDGDNYSPRRQRMSDKLLAAVRGQSRTVLAGDSNAKPTNEALRRLEPLVTKVFSDERVTSFNMRRKHNPGYATAAVDHMYATPDIAVLERHCPDVDVSDHLPIWAVLEVR